jgi:hypothetical protein
MKLSSRTLTALTSAAALTVAGMSSASAASWAHDDAVGDVLSYTSTKHTESGPDPAPANTNTDVTRFTARHTARRVVLKTTLRDITTASGVIQYEIRTGTRRYGAFQRLGTNREMGPAFELMRGNGELVPCTGVRRSVDRITEQATVNIPRSCLGRPRWVRVGAGAVNFKETQTSFAAFVDDALRDGLVKDNLALSPRIQRG